MNVLILHSFSFDPVVCFTTIKQLISLSLCIKFILYFFKVFFTFFFPNIKNRKDLLHLLKGLHVVRYPRGFKHKVDASLPCFKLMYLCAHSQIYNYFVKCKVWTEYTRWTNRNLQYSPTFTRNNHIISSD